MRNFTEANRSSFSKPFFSDNEISDSYYSTMSKSNDLSAWNMEYSNTMASAIICLATNQKFNFSKFIFEGGGPRCQETMGDTIAQNRLKLDELMALCTTLQSIVLDLEKTKTTQANEIASLKRRVKKLKKKRSSRTHKLKRLYKVGLTARIESSGDEEDLGEDASKQGRRINVIDADEDITLVNVQDDVDNEVFDVDALNVSTATTTVTLTTEEITLAQALEALKTSKPKVKGLFFKSQVKLQAEFDKEERLAREKVKKEKEANIALIKEWDDIQANICEV
ncbi:hypothetical protein Tco_0332138 [Tanacetum coccineum]